MNPLARETKHYYSTMLDRFEKLLEIQDRIDYKPTSEETGKLLSNLESLSDCGFPDIESRAQALLRRINKKPLWKRFWS